MLTKLIVASYAWLVEVALWVAILLGAVAGYNAALPVLFSLGAVPTPEFAWQVLGAVLMALLTFLVLAVFAGPLLLLVEIRRSVRSIEALLGRTQETRTSLHSERREPSI